MEKSVFRKQFMKKSGRNRLVSQNGIRAKRDTGTAMPPAGMQRATPAPLTVPYTALTRKATAPIRNPLMMNL